MADPKARKSAKRVAPKAMDVPIVLEATRATPTYYVNLAQVGFGEHEIAVVFARAPTKPSREELQEAEEFGALIIDPELQLILPPTMVPRLIDALQLIQKHYEENIGKIVRNDNAAVSS